MIWFLSNRWYLKGAPTSSLTFLIQKMESNSPPLIVHFCLIECSGSDAMWFPRLDVKRIQLPLGFLSLRYLSFGSYHGVTVAPGHISSLTYASSQHQPQQLDNVSEWNCKPFRLWPLSLSFEVQDFQKQRWALSTMPCRNAWPTDAVRDKTRLLLFSCRGR